MRDETNAPMVPEVSSDSYSPVVLADGGRKEFSKEGQVGDAPLVAQLS